jgi:hypothetical protein
MPDRPGLVAAEGDPEPFEDEDHDAALRAGPPRHPDPDEPVSPEGDAETVPDELPRNDDVLNWKG